MKPVFAYEAMRYGFFVHYIACLAVNKDGSKPRTIDEAADGFDVDDFAGTLAEMRPEYLIFTAWHFRMMPLYPSAVTERYRPGCSVKRDLMGEVIDAVRARGIKVILYTHPRDGHDFIGEERRRCGWGEGHSEASPSKPDFAKFDYAVWNEYVLALYGELMERYASRIDGIYTDGEGPGDTEQPVIDYLAIRRLVKEANPDLVIIQNGFGPLFSNDYTMPEAYFGYELNHDDTSVWPACEKALATSPFTSTWQAEGPYGKDVRRMTPRHIVRFMALQASCAAAGGTCWAAGPYCGGGWDVGVVETMAEVGRLWDSLGKGVKDVVPSTSWPTVSGDTLEALGYVFACTGRSRVYEYVHVMRAQAGRISLPPPADGARLSYPVPVTAGIRVRDFCQDATGVRFSLEGDISEVDTIIRLRRENNPNAPVSIWINDSDKRILYSPGWKYQMLRASYTTHVEHLEQYACYENDSHTAAEAGRRLDTFFNGDEIELYGVLRPDGGKANILIDDICVAHIDTRAPEHKARALLFTSGNLHGGLHTFSVVTTGDGPFEFDALRAWGV